MPGLSFFSEQLDGLATLAPTPNPSLAGRGVSWLNVDTPRGLTRFSGGRIGNYFILIVSITPSSRYVIGWIATRRLPV
jgi:hypothetical protein